MLTGMGFCSGVHTKEMYLPKEVLDGMRAFPAPPPDSLLCLRSYMHI